MKEPSRPGMQHLDPQAWVLDEFDRAARRDDRAVRPKASCHPPVAASTTPVSLHTDLYRYWVAKRGAHGMPRRRDIDPVEIPHLLAHIAIVDRHDGGYRWRLMGSAIVDDFGRDFTGRKVGEYFGPSAFVEAVIATYDRVLCNGCPIFEESTYKTTHDVIHPVSRLLLPLSNEEGEPWMILHTRIMRDGFAVLLQEQDRLKGARGGVQGTFEIETVDDLEARAADWVRRAGKLSHQ